MANEDIRKIYKGYFTRNDVINLFLSSLPKFYNKKIKIADFGGGSGYLLEKVEKFYKDKNHEVECWLIDKDIDQLQRAPKRFNKIQENILHFYKNNYFDLIIMRSTLQFVLKKKDKIKVLNNIYTSLKRGGTFINQALFIEKPDNRFLEEAFRYFNRLLKIETLSKLLDIYERSNFKNCKIINFCPIMTINASDIQERFKLDYSIIRKMYDLFKKYENVSHYIKLEKHKSFQVNAGYVIIEAKK